MTNFSSKHVSFSAEIKIKSKRLLLDAYGDKTRQHGSLKDSILYFSTLFERSACKTGIAIMHKSAELKMPLNYVVKVSASIIDRELFNLSALEAHKNRGGNDEDFATMSDSAKMAVLVLLSSISRCPSAIGVEVGIVRDIGPTIKHAPSYSMSH
jgi:hypothetical protein